MVWRRLMLCLAVLAFSAGLPLALAIPQAFAAPPCPHEHSSSPEETRLRGKLYRTRRPR
jgi:hypothetical protein